MNKSEMLNSIKDYLGISKSKDFADFLGIKPTTLSMWNKRNTFDTELLFKKCDFLNPYWLLTGKGDMLIQNDNLSKKTNPVVEEPINKDSQVIPKQGIPLIPCEAVAGISAGSVSVMEHDIMEYYVVPDFHNVDFMIRVKGLSMHPTYNSGDVIACRMITDSKFLQWNKVHVIATKEQGVLVKRINQSKKDNCILAVSDNQDYAPFDIPKEEILNIALVVGTIRQE